MNLAPTASTTAALALGDALAMALSCARASARSTSPACTRAASSASACCASSTLMHTGDARPASRRRRRLPDVIHEMSAKRLGMTVVIDAAGTLVGIITDGDLRRHMTRGTNLLERRAADVMTAGR